jgi:predicted GNAT family acetyltransferase
VTNPVIRKNEAQHRYEIHVDGQLAGFAEYSVLANGILFSHTEVQPAYEGRGLSSRLIAFALDDVRALKTHAIPACQFVAGFLRKHPEYQDLVSPESRRAFHI